MRRRWRERADRRPTLPAERVAQEAAMRPFGVPEGVDAALLPLIGGDRG